MWWLPLALAACAKPPTPAPGASRSARIPSAEELPRKSDLRKGSELGLRYRAVLFGAEAYPPSSGLTALQSPHEDIAEIGQVLRKKYGFFVEEYPDATMDDIKGKLDELKVHGSPDEALIVYFAGHGVYDRGESRAYWLPVDATQETTARWVSADDVAAKLRSTKARHVWLIVDSCFSGMFRSGGSVAPVVRAVEGVEVSALQRRSRWVTSSGSNEPVADSGAEGLSVFAYHLRNQLRDYGPRYATPEDLFPRLQAAVAEVSEQTPQHSLFPFAAHDGGRFYLVNHDAEPVVGGPFIETPPAPPTPPVAGDPAAWRAQLAAFGEAVATHLGDVPAYLDVPQWDGGCPLGASAAQIRTPVARALGARVDRYDHATTARLRLQVVPFEDEAVLYGEIMRPGEDVWEAVDAEARWAISLMPEAPAQRQECFQDGRMGVIGGHQTGAEDIDLGLALAPDSTQFCPGDQVTVRLTVDRPARVRLYSVAEDGFAVQVWPDTGQPDRLTPEAGLTLPVTMLQTDHGQERFVAVGLPPGAAWPGGDSPRSCRLADGWAPRVIPDGAAVTTQGFRIDDRKGGRACAGEVDAKLHDRLQEVLAKLPACP